MVVRAPIGPSPSCVLITRLEIRLAIGWHIDAEAASLNALYGGAVASGIGGASMQRASATL